MCSQLSEGKKKNRCAVTQSPGEKTAAIWAEISLICITHLASFKLLPGFLDLTCGTEDKAKGKNQEGSCRPEAFCIPVTCTPKSQEDSQVVLKCWLNSNTV